MIEIKYEHVVFLVQNDDIDHKSRCSSSLDTPNEINFVLLACLLNIVPPMKRKANEIDQIRVNQAASVIDLSLFVFHLPANCFVQSRRNHALPFRVHE